MLVRVLFGILFLFLCVQAQAKPVPRTYYTSSQIAALKVFFAKDVIVDAKTLDKSPYVLAQAGEHLMTAAPIDRVYVRGLDVSAYKQQYVLFRVGITYRDPETQKIMGYEGAYVGEGQVIKRGDPAVVQLVKGTREVNVGDRLVPSEFARLDLRFKPSHTTMNIRGQVVAVRGGIQGYGMYQVIIINRGERHGIHLGDVLGVYKNGEKMKTPRDYEGRLVIFKCFDHMSMGLVYDAVLPMNVLDEVSNLS